MPPRAAAAAHLGGATVVLMGFSMGMRWSRSCCSAEPVLQWAPPSSSE